MTPTPPEQLAYVAATVDAIDKRLERIDTYLNKRFDNHGARLSSLEKWRARAIGASAVIVPFFGWLLYG